MSTFWKIFFITSSRRARLVYWIIHFFKEAMGKYQNSLIESTIYCKIRLFGLGTIFVDVYS